MNQTPAAILVLAAAALSHAAYVTAANSQNQPSVLLTLSALGIGAWGVISLIAACVRERELLIDSHARLDVLDRVMVREPLRALKEFARPRVAHPVGGQHSNHHAAHATGASQSSEVQRPLEISSEAQSRLDSLAQAEGRDRSEILDQMLRQHLPEYNTPHAGASRVA